MKKIISIIFIIISLFSFSQTRVMIEYTDIISEIDTDKYVSNIEYNQPKNEIIVNYDEFKAKLIYHFDKKLIPGSFCDQTTLICTNKDYFNDFINNLNKNKIFVKRRKNSWYYYIGSDIRVNIISYKENNNYILTFKKE